MFLWSFRPPVHFIQFRFLRLTVFFLSAPSPCYTQASLRSILKAGSPTAELLTQAISEVIPHAFRAPSAPAEKPTGDDGKLL